MRSLVFVHGYLGGSAQWDDQVNAFTPSYNVITPDLPGFGRNHVMEAPDTIGAFADYVLEQVSNQGVDRFDLIGHSMGGMIVQEIVARAPKRVDHLVLYGTGPIGLLPGRFETIEESRRRVVEDGPEATGKRIAATWFVDCEQATQYPICADLAALASQQAALAGLSAMEKWSGEGALENIASPTLVLWGDCDRTYKWDQQQRLWQGIEGARLAVIPGCAHAVHLEKPDLFYAIVKDFLGMDLLKTQSS